MMKFFTKKRIFISTLAVLVILIAFFAYSIRSYIQQGAVGTGVKAKILCAGVFVSDREPQKVLDEDLSFHSLLDIVKTKIDFDKKEVTASIFGIIKSRAIYHKQLGSILLSGIDEEEIRSWEVNIPDPLPSHPESVPWPYGDLIQDSEEPSGINKKQIEKALDAVFSEPDPENLRRTRAVIVVFDGEIIAERYAPGITKNTPLIGWSMTKSVVNALAGIRVKQGKLSISEPAPVPEWKKKDDPRKAITLDLLLRMSSGLEFYEEYEENPVSDVNTMLFSKSDMGAYAASKPLKHEPGSNWSYSSGTTNIISRIIRHTFNNQEDYFSFPRRELFDKIGMRSAVFEPDASGTFVGSSSLYASARDWTRFGLLYLNDGVWDGERILPEGWVDYTTTPASDSKGRYGAHFWLNKRDPSEPEKKAFEELPEDLFYCSGYQGQKVAIIPSHKLVVVRLGMTHQGGWGFTEFMKKIIKAVPERNN
jgi:CubicO group peptidase (beta-lactamase class C family)